MAMSVEHRTKFVAVRLEWDDKLQTNKQQIFLYNIFKLSFIDNPGMNFPYFIYIDNKVSKIILLNFIQIWMI